MEQLKYNNLTHSSSPYLRQHADNPVAWQEYSNSLIEEIKAQKKPILLSSGYSSCHWCHVMAAEAFSDPETALFLNEHFICIKLDREQHPDIDHFLMEFIVALHGQGGWPLNVFLSSDFKPFYATTYLPAVETNHANSFISILRKIQAWYQENQNFIEPFDSQAASIPRTNLATLIDEIGLNLDLVQGGTRNKPKFPPHSLLFLILSNPVLLRNHLDWAEMTLKKMIFSGLHDSIEGGFFRYCVDEKWEIPHFEKMLYDQAMMLTNLSLGYHLFEKEYFKEALSKLLLFLKQRLSSIKGYYSALDADTNYHEGETYLWQLNELKAALSKEQYDQFQEEYRLIPFEGKYHLIKKASSATTSIESILKDIRIEREQPFRDEKIITSWNALLAIAYLFSARYADNQEGYSEALSIFENLLSNHCSSEGTILHSQFEGTVQNRGTLEDISSLLLLGTYLYEDRLVELSQLEDLYQEMSKFKLNGHWVESFDSAAGVIYASWFDHPIPSSASTAMAAEVRYLILQEKGDLPEIALSRAHFSDFANHFALQSYQELELYKSPNKINWKTLPVKAMQKQSSESLRCTNNKCTSWTGKTVNF